MRHTYNWPEVGIYKRKQESKKTRFRPKKRPRKKEGKHTLDQEKTMTVKKKEIKQRVFLDQESDQEKKKNSLFSYFLISYKFSPL